MDTPTKHKYAVVVDDSVAMREDTKPQLKVVSAFSPKEAAAEVLSKNSVLDYMSKEDIMNSLEGSRGEYYIDGFGDVKVRRVSEQGKVVR